MSKLTGLFDWAGCTSPAVNTKIIAWINRIMGAEMNDLDVGGK